MVLELTGNNLTITDVVNVARADEKVVLSASGSQAIGRSFESLLKLAAAKEKIYGLTVGCGELDTSEISDDEKAQHQRNLILAHAAGPQEPRMRPEQVRAMMLCRLNTLAAGMSGVSIETFNRLLQMLNENIVPVVPQMGSVGASDLIPLAHMASATIGEGSVVYQGAQMPAEKALNAVGMTELTLIGRDGLALINGLSQTTAVAVLALHDIRRLINLSVCSYALTSKLLYPKENTKQARSASLKRSSTLTSLMEKICSLIDSESMIKSGSHTEFDDYGEERSPLSLRYSPQVLSSVIDSLTNAESVLTEELNAVVDNPLIDGDGWHTNNCANTSGHRIGIALEQLSIALQTLAVATERRIAQLLRKDPANGLPPYLIHPESKPGVSYGLMFSQYMAASLIGELRGRAVSRTVQSIPTGGLFEDLVSFSNYSAIHLDWVTRIVETLSATEILSALQGYDCKGEEPPPALRDLAESIRAHVPPFRSDRAVGIAIDSVLTGLRNESLAIPAVV